MSIIQLGGKKKTQQCRVALLAGGEESLVIPGYPWRKQIPKTAICYIYFIEKILHQNSLANCKSIHKCKYILLLKYKQSVSIHENHKNIFKIWW